MIIGQDKPETVLSGILHICLKIIETETSVYLGFHTCHTHTHTHTHTHSQEFLWWMLTLLE